MIALYDPKRKKFLSALIIKSRVHLRFGGCVGELSIPLGGTLQRLISVVARANDNGFGKLNSLDLNGASDVVACW
jgi:hypothetical protein